MTGRRRLSFFVVGLAITLGHGCDRPAAPTASQPAPHTAPADGTPQPNATLRVALLHPGRENDGGWNELAVTALKRLHDRMGATVRHTYAPNKSTYKSDLRDYAAQGYTLVVGHGSEFVKSAREVAPGFPGTAFLVTGSADAGDGVATLDFRLWEATYICGVLAAHLAPDGPAGLIGGQDFVTVRKTMDAFANGARSVKPDYPTFAQYVGSWDDVARAEQTARAQIETRKVKAIFQNTDAAARGIFAAANESGVLVFGCNSNQNALSPGIIPASAVIHMERGFELVLADIRRGEFSPKVYVCDLKSGVVDVELNPSFSDRWPAGAIEAGKRARSAIIAEQIDVLARN